MAIFESAIFWIILAAVSECLSLIPNEKVKSNGLVQLLGSLLETALKSKSSKKQS
jgi:hypothetical protein